MRLDRCTSPATTGALGVADQPEVPLRTVPENLLRLATGLVLAAGLGCSSGDSNRAADDGQAPASNQTTEVPEAGRYRLVGDPIVIIYGAGGAQSPSLQVIVRLNRRLPGDVDEEDPVGANFLVEDAGLDFYPEPIGQGHRRCYSGTIGNDRPTPALAHPQAGQRVLVQVAIDGVRRRLKAYTDLRRSETGDQNHEALNRLGCRVQQDDRR